MATYPAHLRWLPTPGITSAMCSGWCWHGARVVLATRRPSMRRTYGLRSSTILAALINAVVLLTIAVGAIIWEAIERLEQPQPVGGVTVMIVAAVGIVINGITALLFASGRHEDLQYTRCVSAYGRRRRCFAGRGCIGCTDAGHRLAMAQSTGEHPGRGCYPARHLGPAAQFG